MKQWNILALGDICGPKAKDFVVKTLPTLKKEKKIDFVVANGENSAEPNGIDKETAKALFSAGVDVITTGNHVFRKNTVFSYLDEQKNILRPLNFPSECPGHGATVFSLNGVRILCANIMGQAYMEDVNSPFEAVAKTLAEYEGKYDFAILDIHAEATGEKKALFYEFADRFSVIFGTHTHVQTNDAQIENGCGYLTDLGMCGAKDSILGVKKEEVIYRLKTKLLTRFAFADGAQELNGALFTLNERYQTIAIENIIIGE